MSIYPDHLRRLAIRAMKSYPGLYSDDALPLVLGTIAVESDGGTYLRQVGGGPALGIGQTEPVTFNWLRDVFADEYPALRNREFEELEWDLKLAIVMVRLRYRVVPEPLPSGYDLHAVAAYWKQYYNTPLGAGTVEEFARKYEMYVTEGGV